MAGVLKCRVSSGVIETDDRLLERTILDPSIVVRTAGGSDTGTSDLHSDQGLSRILARDIDVADRIVLGTVGNGTHHNYRAGSRSRARILDRQITKARITTHSDRRSTRKRTVDRHTVGVSKADDPRVAAACDAAGCACRLDLDRVAAGTFLSCLIERNRSGLTGQIANDVDVDIASHNTRVEGFENTSRIGQRRECSTGTDIVIAGIGNRNDVRVWSRRRRRNRIDVDARESERRTCGEIADRVLSNDKILDRITGCDRSAAHQ